MLLRQEEGEQRQTVMELIEAPSKEAAIAKAKLKPDAIGARAYASQVKYKGKKYWRVAVDLKRPNKPYTMGDFLKQASPQTQAKVLGSEKRAREFMRKVLGTKDKAPISPDRALREVVNFRPVITRQPRLSMDMKLEISKLKSQKDRFGNYAMDSQKALMQVLPRSLDPPPKVPRGYGRGRKQG
jgi:hypothetical protein